MSTIQPARTHAPAHKPVKRHHAPGHAAAKRQAAQPQPAQRFADRPVFGLSSQLGQEITRPHHPLAVPAGLAIMPVAVAVDLLDVFTRPIQALFELGK